MAKHSRKKILLIDDDPVQLMMYELAFKNFGHGLLTAKSGQEGFRVIKEEKPGLILLDLLLGDADGLEVLKQLKSNQELKGIKVVIVTNFNKKGLAEECRRLGAADFWIKNDFLPKDIVKMSEQYLK